MLSKGSDKIRPIEKGEYDSEISSSVCKRFTSFTDK